MIQWGRIARDQSFQDKVGVIDGFFPDFIYQAAPVWVVGKDVGEVGERPFDGSPLQKEISSNPSSPIRGGKNQDGIFQSALRGTAFSHSMKDPGEIEPVFLLQGVSFDCLSEILDRFFQVNLEEVPLVEDP